MMNRISEISDLRVGRTFQRNSERGCRPRVADGLKNKVALARKHETSPSVDGAPQRPVGGTSDSTEGDHNQKESALSVDAARNYLQEQLDEAEPGDLVEVSRKDLERILKYVDDVDAWKAEFTKLFGGNP